MGVFRGQSSDQHVGMREMEELAKGHNCPHPRIGVTVGMIHPSREACKVVMTWQRA